MRYALIGYGRMGRAVDEQARARGHERTAIVDGAGAAVPGATELHGARVAFEFTTPDAAERNIRGLLEAGSSVVCGTTGFEPRPALAEVAEAAGVGLLIAPNFSIGVQLFFRAVGETARAFATLELYDAFVQEEHHRAKLDAPSGTARRLASILLEADPRLERVVEGHARGPLPQGALSVVATRAGFEPGTHRVGFDGPHDRVTLEHRARGREGFALGAVLAAEWLVGRRGRHEFDEVLDAIVRGELRAQGGAA